MSAVRLRFEFSFDELILLYGPMLTGGESFVSSSDLNQAAVLKLDKAEVSEDSYLRLKFQVINN